jgi:hypothetical protein
MVSIDQGRVGLVRDNRVGSADRANAIGNGILLISGFLGALIVGALFTWTFGALPWWAWFSLIVSQVALALFVAGATLAGAPSGTRGCSLSNSDCRPWLPDERR